MASTSCPACGAWTVGFEYDLTTGEITWYCLRCGHRWRRDERKGSAPRAFISPGQMQAPPTKDARPMNVPKLALYGAGISIGLLGLGVLVAAVIALDCAKRAGLR